MKEEKIYFLSLLKFGSYQNMRSFLTKGQIFFNTIDFFQNLEEQGLRGDNYEFTTRIENFENSDSLIMKIPLEERTIENKVSNLHIREYIENPKGNLFSMYTLKIPDVLSKDFKVDEKVKSFGDYFVYIKKPYEFLKRVSNQLESENFNYKGKLVTYYNKSISKNNLTIFDKTDSFKYQNEFRFVIYNDKSLPISVEIGNIEDIAELFETKLIDNIEFQII